MRASTGGSQVGQFQGTFKRYEKKYLLSEEKYKLVRERLQDKFIVDRYGETTICNIYFDTRDHRLVRSSIEKPIYKEKLRLRSYGTPGKGDTVFVELKKKYKGVVYKRRVDMELTMAEQYLYDSKPINLSSQITQEIDWFKNFYRGLMPAMYISYRRTAMYGREDNDLRITFDRDICWREEELKLESGTWGQPLLQEDWRLMEIKIPGVMPLWLSHILDELEIYPVSFSKYGRGYEESEQIKRKIKGEIKYA